jgi:simple sugar transport system substrate-binding protein
MRAVGGTTRMVGVDTDAVAQATQRVRTAAGRMRADGILALGSRAAEPALRAVRERPGVRVATFDISPDVLEALRTGDLDFAVDQQAYLQGYLPVLFMSQYVRYGLFPSRGEVIATGPNFVTRRTADKALLLSRQGIR